MGTPVPMRREKQIGQYTFWKQDRAQTEQIGAAQSEQLKLAGMVGWKRHPLNV